MNSTQKNRTFAARLGFAINGIAVAIRSERSLRTQTLGLLAVMMALWILHPAAIWWALLLLSSGAVLAAELFNTAIERLADHLHPQQHPAIRIVKDCAAAGVLLTALAALSVAAAFAVDRWL